MKIPWLVGLAMTCTTAAFAQTGAPAATQPPASPAGSALTPTMSVTGCVAGGSKSEPVTLTHAMVLPFNAQATGAEPTTSDLSVPPLPDPAAVSAAATQPQTPRSATPPAVSAAPGAVGTAGSAGTPGTVGTSGVVAGTAPAGSSASSVDGYRLSGVDMTSWIGRRVQIMGTLVPPAAAAQQPVAVVTSDQAAAASMREIRVLSVQPVTGSCPQ